MPADFALTPEMTEYARKCGVLDGQGEFEHFAAHHLSKGSLFERWDMAWMSWCRNAKKMRVSHQRVEQRSAYEGEKRSRDTGPLKLTGFGRAMP